MGCLLPVQCLPPQLKEEESPSGVEQADRSCQRGRDAMELASSSVLLAPGLEARPCGDEAAPLHTHGPCG